MRRVILAGVALLMAACADPNLKPAEQTTQPQQPSAREALELREDLGRILEKSYTGTAPCADCDGVRYQLTLFHQEFSDQGTYDLRIEHRVAGKPMQTRTTCGLWETTVETDSEPQTSAIRLHSGNGSEMGFIRSDNRQTLTLEGNADLVLKLGK